MQSSEELIQLSDPGEIGRAEHNKGDRFVVFVSNIFAWLFPALMIAICAQVILRQAGHNQAWLDDFQWWLYGAAVLIGIGYAVTTNSHVRVDIFYDNFPPEKKARVEVAALAWLFLPFIILSWDVTFHYAVASVIADEGSDSPNGLHNLWILKVLINVAFLFIAVATYSAYYRNLKKLTEPTLFKQLFVAFPTTWFVVNLICYYVIWWAIRLTSGPDVTARDVGRSEIFDEFDVGPYELKYTVVISLVVTILLLLFLRARTRRAEG